MRVKTAIRATFVLLLLSLLAACGGGASGGGGGGGGGEQAATGVVTVAGQVTGSGGLPEVVVTAGGKTATTDTNGYFQLTEVPVPADGRLVISYEKDGYATYQRSLDVSGGNTYVANAKLLAYQSASPLNGDSGGTINNPDGSQVIFPAGAVSGNVTVNMAVGDPTSDEGRAAFPGDYMATDTDDDGPDTPLESVVFTEVTLIDADGNEITQLDAPATVRLRLPDSLQDRYNDGDKIPWWSYDEENATWVREDADPSTPEIDDATVKEVVEAGVSVKYVEAQVTHFTWWNADHPIDEHACLCLTVTDGDGNPLVGVQVIAEGVTYNGRSTPRATDAQGYVCLTVKRSTDANNPERVKIYVEQGGVKFYYDVTDPTEGDPDKDEIYTPTQQGSTIDDSGQCTELANDLEVNFDGRIQGTVYDRDGNRVPGFTFYTSYGLTVTSGNDGTYDVQAPVNHTVSLFYPGWFSDSVQVPDTDPVTHDIHLPDRNPVITRIDRNPDGRIDNGQSVNLHAIASDPDGDTLSYSWTASPDVGSFSNPNAAQTTWTAPNSGTGTVTLTVTVDDGHGGSASHQATVLWGTQTASTHLRFQFYRSRFDQTPVSGVTVKVEGITPEKTSGNDGVVDFGDIGQDHATYTIAWDLGVSQELGFGIMPRNLRTLVNVPVGDTTFYLDQDLGFAALPLFGFQESYFGYLALLQSCDSPDTVTVNASVAPDLPGADNVSEIRILPGTESVYGSSGSVSIDLCPAMLQSNGKVSFLAVAADSQGNLIGWGQLLDQDPTGTFDLVVDQQSETLTWTEVNGQSIPMLLATGVRQGAPYLGVLEDVGGIPPYQQGFPAGFPFDFYWLEASDFGASNGTIQTQAKRFGSFQPQATFTLPDYDLSGSYNTTDHLFSWTVGGSSAVDLQRIGMLYFDFNPLDPSLVSWTITLGAGVTQVDLDDLPLPNVASGWIDLDQIGQGMGQEMPGLGLSVIDYGGLNGLDEVWSVRMQGQPLLAASNRRDSGWKFIEGGQINLFSGPQ